MKLVRTELNESSKTIYEKEDRFRECRSDEERARLLWMWVKQDNITLKEFVIFVSMINPNS